MIKSNIEIQFNCLLIESMVKTLVLNGKIDNELLVAEVNKQFIPKNEFEMEMYSEAILYAKLSLLN
jgi:sulfur carrier protein ThiS